MGGVYSDLEFVSDTDKGNWLWELTNYNVRVPVSKLTRQRGKTRDLMLIPVVPCQANAAKAYRL